MKIAAFNVELQSSRQFSQSSETSERLEMWGNGGASVASGSGAPAAGEVRISDAARRAQMAELAAAAAGTPAVFEIDLGDEIDSDADLPMLIRLIEAITGKPIRRINLRDLGQGAGEAGAQARPQGPGFAYDFSATYSESETTAFSASGVVRTADGAEIRFDLGFEVSRSYSESVSVSLRGGDQHRLQDPLVLDFGGPAAALSDVRFDFDLDGDGSTEKIPLLGGSGYLAFDRNANGRVDDGRELFGPRTGNGFDELAALDGDGNGWIDENDAAWSQLRVWQPDARGEGTLQTLAEAGVGAFYLGRADTQFSLKDAANETLGMMRASSIYLREDGSVGTVSQVDLAV
ncbi:hypothetical protein [Thauera linaloolentis]|uniref:VCBS repeat-containing protein n=1 Tax=Thauera linaloolentis (strain DSM 12138 / JCM 21573 / CCUG 41526 / CIP 105981 / IAM 15112 / NBRC 102519 / 47Lol) TaxID=1123367 RepID=N6XZZ7_THAL4|nr:hypothetical protein [Thauera linaloolentis]ENO87431.1 hypothetical protein C666_11075 [Thauera linaloolentis 47Lol = DSM 12138]MCM8565081.1 hypothetical protein [Thauera linaloolentis]